MGRLAQMPGPKAPGMPLKGNAGRRHRILKQQATNQAERIVAFWLVPWQPHRMLHAIGRGMLGRAPAQATALTSPGDHLALTLRAVVHSALRQTEGLIGFGLEVPNRNTPSRQVKTLPGPRRRPWIPSPFPTLPALAPTCAVSPSRMGRLAQIPTDALKLQPEPRSCRA